MISFLNALLHNEQVIKDITYMNSKHLGVVGVDRKAIFDLIFDEDNCYHHEVKLIDTSTNKVFYNKLTFTYLEMPKFLKKEDELETMFDKWMFVLRNLTSLMNRPSALQERIFEKVFCVAEIAQFTPVERSEYEDRLKVLRDLANALDTAALRGYEKGVEKGREEEKRTIVRNLKNLSLPIETIMQVTGLSPEDISNIE